MNKPLVIGLTGGIGSGKSTALKEFRRHGASVVDLDAIVRSQSKRGPVALKLRKAFGTTDRAAIAKQVFSSASKRRSLEKLTHPPILSEMRKQIKKAKGVVVVDVPLLFETSMEKEFDATITISAPQAARLRRLAARGLPPAQARSRMRAQLTDAARESRADVTLRNDGTQTDFKRKVAHYARGLRLMQASPQ